MTSSNIPNFGDYYLQFYDPSRQQFEVRRKSREQSNVNISQAMELVGELIKKHQLSFVPNRVNPKLIFLPFAIIEPQIGDQIRNKTTNEVYTIEQVVKNPTTNRWDGVVQLSLVNPPSVEFRHSLEYLNPDRYIKFDHTYPDQLLNIINANSEGKIPIIPPIHPTITWSLSVVEPGGRGKPFDTIKELKPMLRELVKDPLVPGYTVEIYGQWFDNIVQFDSWSNSFRTSERLISWMEQLLKIYAGYLRQSGVSNLFFWKRDGERQTNVWRQDLPVKSTQFYFRTEELEAVYTRDILKVDISLGVSETRESPNNHYVYIADQLISGNYTPEEYRSLFYRSGEYLFGEIDIRQ